MDIYGKGLFAGFSNLREVSFNGAVNISNSSSASEMFKGCSKLERIDFTGFQTDTGFMEEMFSGCASLTSLDLRSFHFSTTTGVSGIFAGCTNLAEVVVNGSTRPELVARLEAEMGDCATHTVTVDCTQPSDGSAAAEAPVYVTPEEIAEIPVDEFVGIRFLPSKQGAPEGYTAELSDWDRPIKGSLLDPVPAGKSWVEKRPDGYVVCLAADERLLLGASPTYMFTRLRFRGQGFSGAGNGLPNLREIELNGCLDGKRVYHTDNMFSGDASLTTVDLSSVGMDQIESMRGMFSGCTNLTTVDLSGIYISGSHGAISGTKLTGIFEGCTSLTEVIVNRSIRPEVIEALKAEMANCAGQTVTVR